MRKALLFIGNSLAAAILLSLFIHVPTIARYLFSLGALFLIYRYFKILEGWIGRGGFIVLVLVLTLTFSTFYVALAYINGWYINPIYLDGIE